MFEFVLKLYSALGLFFGLGGFAYFIVLYLDITITPKQQIALTISGVGLALSAMSYVTLIWRRQREAFVADISTRRNYVSELVDGWAMFENAGHDLVAQSDNKGRVYPLRALISKLRGENYIDDADLNLLQEALELRNQVVHGRGAYSPEALQKIIQQLTFMNSKLAKVHA